MRLPVKPSRKSIGPSRWRLTVKSNTLIGAVMLRSTHILAVMLPRDFACAAAITSRARTFFGLSVSPGGGEFFGRSVTVVSSVPMIGPASTTSRRCAINGGIRPAAKRIVTPRWLSNSTGERRGMSAGRIVQEMAVNTFAASIGTLRLIPAPDCRIGPRSIPMSHAAPVVTAMLGILDDLFAGTCIASFDTG